ncbi:MAG: hypothetical protein K9M02_07795 [Thiohalocapsa sp.]|nr:hypothetical protein [Thiohalocapsa sp.]
MVKHRLIGSVLLLGVSAFTAAVASADLETAHLDPPPGACPAKPGVTLATIDFMPTTTLLGRIRLAVGATPARDAASAGADARKRTDLLGTERGAEGELTQRQLRDRIARYLPHSADAGKLSARESSAFAAAAAWMANGTASRTARN